MFKDSVHGKLSPELIDLQLKVNSTRVKKFQNVKKKLYMRYWWKPLFKIPEGLEAMSKTKQQQYLLAHFFTDTN